MKIMIVDDNEENLYLLEVLLRSEKYEVVCARDGLEALEHLKKGSFGLIISDILMPRMDGFQLCRECKGDPHLKYIPFIFYTATYTDQKDEEFALNLGADRFIVKPIETQVFLTTIRGVIMEYEKGAVTAKESLIKDEELYLAVYNKRLIQKLEKKMLDLEMVHKTLAESEKKYRTLVTQSPDGIFIVDLQGTFLAVNKAMCERLKYSEEEFLSMKIWDIVPEKYVDLHKKRLADILRGEAPNEAAEYVVRGKDEKMHYIEILSTPYFRENEVIGFQGIARDITERKRAEGLLKKSEERFRTSVETLLVGFAILSAVRDSNGQIIDFKYEYINEAGCKMNQKPHEEHMGKTLLELLPTHKKIGLFDEYVRVVETGQPLTKEFLIYETVYGGGERLRQAFDVRITRLGDGFVTTWQDITDKKKGEELLRQSEERLKLLIENSKDVVIMADLEGSAMYYNGPPEYGITAEEVLGKNPFSIFEPAIAASLMNQLKLVIKGGEALTFENNIPWRGESFWFLNQMYPIRDEEGRMIAVGVIARNITERKRAEEALRKSEENYRLILDNIPLFIAAIDQTGKFFLWNKYAEKMLGYTSQEAIGKIIPLDIHETKKDADEVIRVASERGIYDKEIRFRHKDKTFIPVRLVVVPNKDSTGKIVGFYGFGEDITERKRAEEALKKSAQLLRDTGEMAKVGGWELDLSTKEVLWTEEVHRIHGVEPGYKPKLEEAMNFYAPESRPALEVVLKKVAETGEPYDLESLFIPSGSKDKIWVRSLGRAVYSGGKIVKLTGIFQNIDKYKRAEEALRVSLEKYRVLFESFPLGITISDKSGKIIEGNRQSEQLLGITREAHAQRRIDSKEWQIIRKDGTPMPADEYASTRALRENRLIENVEMGIVKDKGEITWISVTAAPILLEGYGVAIVYGDITERKRAEEEIKNLAKFPAENPFPILRLNQDGIVLYANEASQVLLRDWGCMVGGYAPKFWCDLATEALASQSRRTIDVGCGQQVYSFVVAPISDAGYVNLYGEDITERKRVEEALRRKSGEQALLLDNIQTQVWYLTDKETYGAVNKARAEFFGKKNEEMENKKLYDVLGKNEAEICMSGYAEVFEKRKQIHTEEWITNAKDEKRLLSIIKSPKLDENGDVGYVVCSAEDITERKRAEKERDQLFEQVRASRERLRNLSRRLVEVQEVERHDLVRKLHDEVGQSLTALSINLNIVHSQLPPETAIKTATRIDDSLKLVEETVERIRDVMVELRPPVLDDYGVSATLHWYGKQFSERTGIPAVLKVEELKPRLPLPEETALFRIAQEALTNVAKYAQAKNVTVGLKEFDKVIYLTIADDGVGFDPTAHHQPGARPEWGLINMRERAQTVGGTLNIETAPGKGTRIMVEVPRNR